ncbi:hypothetical protein SDC9_92300 [bioreactor metagenome]|uniref:Uncharacterized protein n=1 Tax=bioreactor metagenome TaxID=1076179 RepID=A0A644ZXR6_9ZZZZ
MRFIATASVACASVEIEPSDIAPVAKRLTISAAGSTSSTAIALVGSTLNSNRPRSVMWRLLWSLMSCAYSLYVLQLLERVECCSLAMASGDHMCSSPRARQAYSPPAASMVSSTGSSLKAAMWLRMASSAISNTPMPSTRLAVPVKYLFTVSLFRPTTSNNCAPQ